MITGGEIEDNILDFTRRLKPGRDKPLFKASQGLPKLV
jgi:hypothetical protein